MNTIQRYIPFYDLAVLSPGYEIDKELIWGREQKILKLATLALTYLSLAILSTSGVLTFSISLTSFAVFSAAFFTSQAASRMISLKFSQWDKARAENSIIKKAEWLINSDDAVSILNQNNISVKANKKLLITAVQQKKSDIAGFLWEKLTLSDKRDLFSKYPSILQSLSLMGIGILDIREMAVTELFEIPEPNAIVYDLLHNYARLFVEDSSCFFNSKFDKNTIEERIYLLWDKADQDTKRRASEDIIFSIKYSSKIRPYMKIAHEAVVNEFMDDKYQPDDIIFDWLVDHIDALKLLNEKYGINHETKNSNQHTLLLHAQMEDKCEAFAFILNTIDINKDSSKINLFFKNTFRLTLRIYDNPQLPNYLIKNKLITAKMFTIEERHHILYDRIFFTDLKKSKFASERDPYTAKFWKRENCQIVDEIWVERLVRLGFDLDAKNLSGDSVADILIKTKKSANDDLTNESVISISAILGIEPNSVHEYLSTRCDFIANLRKKIFLERLPLIHHLITENAVGDVAGQIFNFYNILSLTPLK